MADIFLLDIVSTFAAVDLETTGLDEEKCDTIEVGAIIDDWLFPLDNPPEFHCYIKKDTYRGEPYALSMHADIFRRIATNAPGYKYLFPGEFAQVFGYWLESNGAYVIDPENPDREARGVVAGKNYASFDDKFLRKFPKYDQYIKLHHRILDPGMALWQPACDTKPPGSQTCMDRTHQDGVVSHTALEDARSVVKMIHYHVGRSVKPNILQAIGEYRQQHYPDRITTPKVLV